MGFRITNSNPNGFHEIRLEGSGAKDNARVVNGMLNKALKDCGRLATRHAVSAHIATRRGGTNRIEVYYPLPESSAAYVTALEGYIKRAIKERNLAVSVETEYKPAFVRVEGHPEDLEQLAARLRGDERLGGERPQVDRERTGFLRKKLAALVVRPGEKWQTVQAAEEYIREHYGHFEGQDIDRLRRESHLVATWSGRHEPGYDKHNPRLVVSVNHPSVPKKEREKAFVYGIRTGRESSDAEAEAAEWIGQLVRDFSKRGVVVRETSS